MAAQPDALAALVERAGLGRRPAPVHLWNPANSGTIDIRIDRAGEWYHEGGPILREGLVRLFSGILRREPDGTYVLVTPVEKLAITVEDVPFLAVELASEKGDLVFRTNVGDIVRLDGDHPLRVAVNEKGEMIPYVTVRTGLEARLTRSVALELMDLAVVEQDRLGVRSAGEFFAIAPASEAIAPAGEALAP